MSVQRRGGKKVKKNRTATFLAIIGLIIAAFGAYIATQQYKLNKIELKSKRDQEIKLNVKNEFTFIPDTIVQAKENKPYSKSPIKINSSSIKLHKISFNNSFFKPKIDSAIFLQYDLSISDANSSVKVEINYTGKIINDRDFTNIFDYSGGDVKLLINNQICKYFDFQKQHIPSKYGLSQLQLDKYLKSQLNLIFEANQSEILKSIKLCLED